MGGGSSKAPDAKTAGATGLRTRARRKASTFAPAPEVIPPARDQPAEPQIGGLKEAFRGTSLLAWDIKLRVVEVALTSLVLVVTIIIGIQANLILSRQNSIVERQSEADGMIGREQHKAALLQAYVASAQAAGYDTPRERRMLYVTFDLYETLKALDPRFRTLRASLPVLTDDQFAGLLRSRPADEAAIRQAWGRQVVSARTLDQAPVENAPFHLVIGTFRQDNYARGSAVRAAQLLRGGRFAPQVRVWRNGSRFFVVTLSSFRSREAADTAIEREQLQSRFNDVYSTQTSGLVSVCMVREDFCR